MTIGWQTIDLAKSNKTPYKGGPVVRTYFKGSIGIRCYPQDRGRPERAISQ